MKKIFTLFGLLSSSIIFAQVARIPLIEEFTQASCPPCASQNPDFNTLLQANGTSVISIKYQTSFPGEDPMNAQNPTPVASKVSYYGITGVPTAAINGTVPDLNYAGGAGSWQVDYPGGPYGFNQNVLEYAKTFTTPLQINIDHEINSGLDSISIHVSVKNMGNDTIFQSDWKLYNVLVEREIEFQTPPGTNGELEFFDVMKQIYASNSGTLLPTLAPGAQYTSEVKYLLPTYIYDYRQVAVVSYVQDISSKEVLQSALSNKKPIVDGVDASIKSLKNSNITTCSSTYEPKVKITNNGSTIVNSIDLQYQINSDTPVAESWTGILNPGSSIDFTFAQTNLSSGNNNIQYSILKLNGKGDYLPQDNIDISKGVVFANNILPQDSIIEIFETSLSSSNPLNTTVVESKSTQISVVPTTGYHSNKSVRFNFFNIIDGEVVSMTYDKIDLSNRENNILTFAHAYARYPNLSDRLVVEASKNCGDSWTTLFDKSGENLKTATQTSSAFTPNKTTNWVLNTIDMSAFDHEASVILKFTGISNYGNNLYLDTITLNGNFIPLSVSDLNYGSLKVFPNPANEYLNIELPENSIGENIMLINQLGQIIETDKIQQNGFIQINTKNLQEGFYILSIAVKGKRYTQKINLIH